MLEVTYTGYWLGGTSAYLCVTTQMWLFVTHLLVEFRGM